jgi:uncharacterized protein YbjT (DUF2867 family)
MVRAVSLYGLGTPCFAAPAAAGTIHRPAAMGGTVVVVGATGMLGVEVCRRFREHGIITRALVRGGSDREQTLGDAGVGIVHGDLKDPPSLEPLCRDALAIVSTANSVLSRRAGDTFAAVDRDGHLL